jgi:hypothetical protein
MKLIKKRSLQATSTSLTPRGLDAVDLVVPYLCSHQRPLHLAPGELLILPVPLPCPLSVCIITMPSVTIHRRSAKLTAHLRRPNISGPATRFITLLFCIEWTQLRISIRSESSNSSLVWELYPCWHHHLDQSTHLTWSCQRGSWPIQGPHWSVSRSRFASVQKGSYLLIEILEISANLENSYLIHFKSKIYK